MENDVLENVLTPGTEVETEEGTEESTFDHSFDLTDDDLASDDNEIEEQSISNSEEEVEEPEEVVNEQPANAAFAQMRTQNKEYQNKINEIDALAKELGMQDVDDFIAKVRDANVKKKATTQGIPVEVARELEEMRALKNSIISEREEAEAKQKEQNFVSNLQEFVGSNKLSKTAIDRLSQDLEKDGFSVDMLMGMPKAALNKVLSSYVDTKYQRNLERKNTIRKELPINQTSKIDTESLNKEIDALAKQLAGKR